MEEDLRGQGTRKFSIFDVASQIILQMTPNEFLGINFFSLGYPTLVSKSHTFPNPRQEKVSLLS